MCRIAFLIFCFPFCFSGMVRSQSALTPMEQIDSISNELASGSWNLSGVLLSKGLVYRLRNLPFNENGNGFSSESVPALDSLADFLRLNPSIELAVSVHFESSDPSGMIKQDVARAKAILKYISLRRINSKRLKVAPGGIKKPLYPDGLINLLQSPELKALYSSLNSRVDFEITANLN
jgi:hypothetical protein